ncbi:hypothetical protein COY25_02700 [Candidatus Uhrbacteria bacterium CG_4_10_14_0_2_um_filter_41_7]|uniref:GH10 domain-containing protein n=1 Tax=Candidatus Uhrbacteria bacterium CG_4_9_14_3_um_filter_41_35 TaxID=1975034 RepID=A0A2M7XFG1_9BACT|nr:MAG: hypothetical protein COV92_01730 [Candidatus Uhrbacteria bacterium CG11_big_fil_rev_8_21_14_0_20_41_9]PIZ54016.1 MAG: hypothetical protein COY25_02700 [Candidatus Uhrbacteria bacterium CG_4_10_14_0_2_um_filter_41_7]PJA46617.1 MAG: hypothetical protein CO173_02510 [Candidatus Uhrbacteria bacterium CG_4_9_14_3_um_filter_41_35]
MNRKWGRVTLIFALIVLMFTTISVLVFKNNNTNLEIGATLSTTYSKELGLDPIEVLQASISDLGIKKYRVPIYWSEIERVNNVYDYTEMDKIMEIARANDLKLTLVIGQKVPRWPECFIPDWAEKMQEQERDYEIMEFIEATVNRYRDSENVERWQIENESFFPFGKCLQLNPGLIQNEINLVRAMDDKPIQLTVSGEQSLWVWRALPADVLGVSLYRKVYDKNFGEIIFPYTALMYNIQRRVANIFVDKVIISELQAEPWGVGSYIYPITNNLDKAYAEFTLENLAENLVFAKRTGADEVYLWGIEWWYFLKVNNDARLWDGAELLLSREL